MQTAAQKWIETLKRNEDGLRAYVAELLEKRDRIDHSIFKAEQSLIDIRRRLKEEESDED